MCKSLMKEQLWAQPAKTIEMYSMKKQLSRFPEFEDKALTELNREERNTLSEDTWKSLLTKPHPLQESSIYEKST